MHISSRLSVFAGLLSSCVAVASSYADSVVTFNEIMYHPATNEAALEQVELYNPMSYDMDISRWKLRGGVEYDFSDGTLVPAHGYLLVASSPAELTAYSGATNVVGKPTKEAWPRPGQLPAPEVVIENRF